MDHSGLYTDENICVKEFRGMTSTKRQNIVLRQVQRRKTWVYYIPRGIGVHIHHVYIDFHYQDHWSVKCKYGKFKSNLW